MRIQIASIVKSPGDCGGELLFFSDIDGLGERLDRVPVSLSLLIDCCQATQRLDLIRISAEVAKQHDFPPKACVANSLASQEFQANLSERAVDHCQGISWRQ